MCKLTNIDSKYRFKKSKSIIILLLFLIFGDHLLIAQTFTGSSGPIVDFIGGEPQSTIFSLTVEGLSDALSESYGLEKVCINIRHKRARDLKIELLSPSGETVWLSNRNSAPGSYGYFETCFKQNGFNGEIVSPSALFNGEFNPEGRLEYINNGQNPNGNWFLIITDLQQGEIGKLLNWNITFSDNPATETKSKCNKANIVECFAPDANSQFLPDLIISPKLTSDFMEYFDPESNEIVYRNQIRLAVAMANIGLGPFEISGTNNWLCKEGEVSEKDLCNDGSYPRQRVSQKIYGRNHDTLTIHEQMAGYLYYDPKPGHNHYHVDDWVTFSLLKKRWWTKNPKRWKIIGSSNKVSYCLFDNKICSDQNQYCKSNNVVYSEKNLQNFGFGNYNSCNSRLQGMSVGGVDYYGKFYEGQFINIPRDIKPGIYYIYITVDPLNQYKEANELNNNLLIKIKFSKSGSKMMFSVLEK